MTFVFVFLFLFVYFVPVPLWIAAMRAQAPVSLLSFIGMRLRRVPAREIVRPLIRANRADLELTVDTLERHYLAGGNVSQVVDALISAQKADIDLTFDRATTIDLDGHDVLEAVGLMAKQGTTEINLRPA